MSKSAPEGSDACARADEHQRQARIFGRPERAAAAQVDRQARRLRAGFPGQHRRQPAVQPPGRDAAFVAVLRRELYHRERDVHLHSARATLSVVSPCDRERASCEGNEHCALAQFASLHVKFADEKFENYLISHVMDGISHNRGLPARQTKRDLTILAHHHSHTDREVKMHAWCGCARGDDAMEYMRGANAGSASSSASSGGAQLGYLVQVAHYVRFLGSA